MENQKTFNDLEEMLMKELDTIVKSKDIDEKKLCQVDKLVDIVKDIKEIHEKDDMANIEDIGYSQRRGYVNRMPIPYEYGYGYGGGYFDDGNSYARGGNYNRGGNYVRGNNGNMNGGNSNRGGYSRGTMMEHYQDMMDNAQNDQEREMISQMMRRNMNQ